MRIFCAYETTEEPWGGANTFLRALYNELTRTFGFELTSSFDDKVDLVFLNQTSRGPGASSSQLDDTLLDTIWTAARRVPVVIRAVNLRQHISPQQGLSALFSEDRRRDKKSISILNRADFVIFQSKYQKEFFFQYGCRPKCWEIIINGASLVFSEANYFGATGVNPLKIFASSFSSKKIKRHDILAALSLVDGVELSFAGQWREGLDPGAVRLLGTISHGEMISHLSNSHYFAHPATKDCCPNSMVEALACGVPVLFGAGPGSGPELGSTCGIAISEQNLDLTVEMARQQYHALRGRLVNNRQEFSIRRAAESYARVFEKVVQSA